MKSVSQVYESSHPYTDNLKERWTIKIPRSRFLTIKFDPLSKTEERRDFLRFLKLRPDGSYYIGGYSDSAPLQDRYGEERYSGSSGWPGTGNIPALVIPNDTVFCTFDTDDSTVDWGYRFTVSADILSSEQVVVHSWFSHILDICRELVTSAVHASTGPSINPLSIHESCYLRWIQNPLFSSGLQKSTRIKQQIFDDSENDKSLNESPIRSGVTSLSQPKRKERRLSVTYQYQKKNYK